MFAGQASFDVKSLIRLRHCDLSGNTYSLTTTPSSETVTVPSTSAFTETLPPEILTEVFIHCVVNDSNAPASLIQVSRRWRDIANSSSSVWQFLALDGRCSDSERRLQLKVDLWLARSTPMPLDFQISYIHTESLLPILSHILPAVGRWREGTFIGKCASMTMPTYRCDGKPPTLETLGLMIIPPDDDDPLNLITVPETDKGDEGGAQDEVKTLRFNRGDDRLSALVLGAYALPSPEHMTPLSSLTELRIGYYNYDVALSPHQILAFLTVCPALETFWFDNGWSHDPEPPEACIGMPLLALPHLRTLTLRSLLTSRCILSHIAVPTLDTLTLIHINSASNYELPRLVDPGDSDDEAHDFSQSPWTDHATGMGLRSLFSRCDPPLRVLDMDYADLRTKDFKWAFARLRLLESLRVVASDMSDNVARALQPAEGWVPLPRLSRLELCKCQKLSGDAIEEMIKSRIQAAKEGVVASMEEVKVINCVGFSVANSHAVEEIFRPRSGFKYFQYEHD